MTDKTGVSQGIRPADLYEISQVITQAPEWKQALDQIAGLLRSTLIFDNLAIFLSNTKINTLEVMFARAVGRGRGSGADITWGIGFANRVAEARQVVVQEPQGLEPENRLNRPFILGVPLIVNQRLLGVMVMIRFGGPEYSQDDIQLIEFFASQIALLIERENLNQEYENLRAIHNQTQLQDDFISTITHELRSPLGFIKGYATTLLRADTSWEPDTQQEFLRIIDQETDHLQELIDNLLDSARLQSGQLDMRFQPVRLDSVMNDVIMRAHLQHPGLEINLHIASKLQPIKGNPQRLSQVFENLLSNAVKYAPGSVIDIHILPDKTHVEILFADHGAGISEKHLPFIFNRFFRSPDQPPGVHGTGLGLYICKQIIQAHHGDITASSTPGIGTTFRIVLPVE